MHTVNSKILEYLKSNGIQQKMIAEKIGMDQASLNRLLRSDDMKVSVLQKISEALSVNPVVFLSDHTPEISAEEFEGIKRKLNLVESEIELVKHHFIVYLQMRYHTHLDYTRNELSKYLEYDVIENLEDVIKEHRECGYQDCDSLASILNYTMNLTREVHIDQFESDILSVVFGERLGDITIQERFETMKVVLNSQKGKKYSMNPKKYQ